MKRGRIKKLTTKEAKKSIQEKSLLFQPYQFLGNYPSCIVDGDFHLSRSLEKGVWRKNKVEN